MKKIIIISLVSISALYSCKKDFTCDCTVTNTTKVTEDYTYDDGTTMVEASSDTTSTVTLNEMESYKLKKKEQANKCSELETTLEAKYNFSDNSTASNGFETYETDSTVTSSASCSIK